MGIRIYEYSVCMTQNSMASIKRKELQWLNSTISGILSISNKEGPDCEPFFGELVIFPFMNNVIKFGIYDER